MLFNIQNQDSIPDFVKEYHEVSTEKEELSFIKKYKKSTEVNVLAFVVSLQMKQAKYKTFPWSKLKVFNKEKKKLNKLIESYPTNVCLRYVRLVIQENTPKFLGYNKNIKEDKLFLKSILDKEEDSDYLDKFIIKNTSL